MNSIKSVISGKYNKKEVKNMDNNMIVKIKKCLDELEKKTVRVSQNGFIIFESICCNIITTIAIINV